MLVYAAVFSSSPAVPAQIKTEKLGEDFISLALDLKHYIADTTLTSYDIKLVTGLRTFNLKVSSPTDVIRINGLSPDTAYTISILNSGFKDVKIHSKFNYNQAPLLHRLISFTIRLAIAPLAIFPFSIYETIAKQHQTLLRQNEYCIFMMK